MSTKKTVDLPIALPVLGIDRGMFQHWFRQGRADGGPKVFKTKFKDPKPGLPREFTRENCLEIAFFVELHSILSSKHPSAVVVAIALAQHWLKLDSQNKLGAYWVYDAWRRLPNDGFIDDDLTVDELAKLTSPPVERIDDVPLVQWHAHEARSICIINVREIIRQVDALLADKGTPVSA